jgi:tripartite-type tricarboxylate transporter receptor subunit TctC
LPGFDVSAWNALFAPRMTPSAVVGRLNAALGAALDDPAVRSVLLGLGTEIPEPAERSPAALATLVKSEIAKWMPLMTRMEPAH